MVDPATDPGHPLRQSTDHILPRSRGGAGLHDIANNRRIMCQRCNSFLAACHHCVAVVACIRDVAADRGLGAEMIYKAWRIVPPVAPCSIYRRRKPGPAHRSFMRDKTRVTLGDVLAQALGVANV